MHVLYITTLSTWTVRHTTILPTTCYDTDVLNMAATQLCQFNYGSHSTCTRVCVCVCGHRTEPCMNNIQKFKAMNIIGGKIQKFKSVNALTG